MRYLVLVLCLTLPAWPQACEATASARKILEQLQIPGDARITAERRLQAKLDVLRNAIVAAPKDIHLHEAYQHARLDGLEANRGPLIAEYETLLAKTPDDAAILYATARSQAGRKTPAAIANLEKALEVAPSFGLPHLLLAQIYNSNSNQDVARMNRHLARFVELCPLSVRTLPGLNWNQDKKLVAREAARLRKNLVGRTDADAVGTYMTLWSLEKSLVRSDEQAENLERMRQDLAWLSGGDFVRNTAWLAVFQGLAFFDGAPPGLGAKAQAEIAARYPNSGAAMNAEVEKLVPQYARNQTPEQMRETSRKRWQALLPLVRKWPASQGLADSLARSIMNDPSATNEEISEAMKLFKHAIELDPDGLRTSPPEAIWVSELLTERGGPWEDIPDLVMLGLTQANRQSGNDSANDVTGPSVAAVTEMRDMWQLMGFLPLAEAYVRLNRVSSAKDILLQIEEKLRRMRPPENGSSSDKFRHAEQEAQFWFVRGQQAEKEGRKMDALVDYRNSISLFPARRPRGDRRDEVMASAERLWKELGGTPQGWNDWAARNPLRTFYAGSDGSDSWTKLAAGSPNLVLNDTLGNRINPADLAKKTVFLNMWASWCGPCRVELPYLEKLYQRFREREDVAILAFNVDEEPGAMKKALDELKVSLPSVEARNFAYTVVPEMALPANWIITTGKMEIFYHDGSPEAWLESAAAAIEKAAKPAQPKQ